MKCHFRRQIAHGALVLADEDSDGGAHDAAHRPGTNFADRRKVDESVALFSVPRVRDRRGEIQKTAPSCPVVLPG